MTIRKLTPEEWFRVAPIFAEVFNEAPPPPANATIVVAEEGGEIVGFGTAHTVVHVEPWWIKPSHRGRYIIPLIADKISDLFPDMGIAFACTASDRVAGLLKAFGFEQLPWKIFRWRRSK